MEAASQGGGRRSPARRGPVPIRSRRGRPLACLPAPMSPELLRAPHAARARWRSSPASSRRCCRPGWRSTRRSSILEEPGRQASARRKCLARAARRGQRRQLRSPMRWRRSESVFPGFLCRHGARRRGRREPRSVLSRLAEFLERSQAPEEHIKSALIYPLIVALTCFASIAMLFVFVVPRFRPLFEEAGAALPLRGARAARRLGYRAGLLVARARRCRRWSPSSSGASSRSRRAARVWTGGAAAAAGRRARRPRSRSSRFSRTLGTLLQERRVAADGARRSRARPIGNRVFAEAVARVIDRVKTARGWPSRCAQTKVFPPLAVHLIRVGEESGRQDEMLLKIADIFEARDPAQHRPPAGAARPGGDDRARHRSSLA